MTTKGEFRRLRVGSVVWATFGLGLGVRHVKVTGLYASQYGWHLPTGSLMYANGCPRVETTRTLSVPMVKRIVRL